MAKMVQTVDRSMFVAEFYSYGRADSFSRLGLEALFDHCEELGTDDEPFVLDVVALCCDWSEYDSIADALKDFVENADGDDLRRMTTVLDVENGHVLVEAF